MKGRIVAFDYGLKRTGIAWTDPLQIIANGVICLPTEQLNEWIMQQIHNECIVEFLVGYPTDFASQPTHATEPVKQFIHSLQTNFPNIPVKTWDERLTSKAALQALILANVPRSKRSDKKLINVVAATIMLQEYLQFLKR